MCDGSPSAAPQRDPSVSPAEPPEESATVTPALVYCDHGYSEGEHCRTCEIMGCCKSCIRRADPSVSPAEPPERCEILPLVIADLTERIAVGTAEYGSALAVESPNDALRYAYEEALDLALYLRQELARRG